MSLPELFLILLVALVAFGPKQLPTVARHITKAIRMLTHFKESATKLWQDQEKEWQLVDNEEKAAKADRHYQSTKSSGNRSIKE